MFFHQRQGNVYLCFIQILFQPFIPTLFNLPRQGVELGHVGRYSSALTTRINALSQFWLMPYKS
jgi:hypothetical protein